MSLDYFVVGPRLALRSRPPDASLAVHPYRLEFAVCDPDHGELGAASAELVGGRIHIELSRSCGRREHEAETIRLVTGICTKLAGLEIVVRGGPEDGDGAEELLAHGFRHEPGGGWSYRASHLEDAEKVASMERLYDDPFGVVWNFEPRQWELLGPFVNELRSATARIAPRVLDLGCGFGKNSVLLEELGFEVHGIDVAEGAIERCRRWVRHPERFRRASIERLPFADGFFTAALDVGCLHCADPELLEPAVDEIARVLTDGGRLFSRFFKPRSAAWIGTQRFRTTSMGLSREALCALLEPRFSLSIWEDLEMTCVRGVRR